MSKTLSFTAAPHFIHHPPRTVPVSPDRLALAQVIEDIHIIFERRPIGFSIVARMAHRFAAKVRQQEQG